VIAARSGFLTFIVALHSLVAQEAARSEFTNHQFTKKKRMSPYLFFGNASLTSRKHCFLIWEPPRHMDVVRLPLRPTCSCLQKQEYRSQSGIMIGITDLHGIFFLA
jgi:hypothetical protein